MKQALYVLVGVLAGFVFAGLLVFVSRAPSGQAIVLQPAPTKPPIVVQVLGAVPRPDVYEFPEGARVQDAVDAAGGLLAEADVSTVNLAALLEDGQQVVIPYLAGSEPSGSSGVILPFSNPTPTAFTDPFGNTVFPVVTEDPAIPGSNADLVNINTAGLDELDALPGIGPATAQKIIDYRTANGPFLAIEDILNVSGIGPATFEDIKNLITTQ
jgi:competence protein ComEA